MKTSTKTSVILKALDIQLKAMLKNDLENYRLVTQVKKTTAAGKQLLAA